METKRVPDTRCFINWPSYFHRLLTRDDGCLRDSSTQDSLINPLHIYHQDPHPYKTSKVLSSQIPLNYTSSSTKNVIRRSHLTDEPTFFSHLLYKLHETRPRGSPVHAARINTIHFAYGRGKKHTHNNHLPNYILKVIALG